MCEELTEIFGHGDLDDLGYSTFSSTETQDGEARERQYENYCVLRRFGKLCFASNAKYANKIYCMQVANALVETMRMLPTREMRMPCQISFPFRNMFPNDARFTHDGKG